MNEVFLSLGSNIGDRIANIKKASELLSFINDKTFSSFYESPALLPDGHEQSWDMNFINIAVCGLYPHDVEKLLHEVKQVELSMGRDPDSPRWSPRVIDIDIIFFGSNILNTNKISIPHPEMHKRSFVVVPIYEINPDFSHPILHKTMRQLKESMNEDDLNALQIIT